MPSPSPHSLACLLADRIRIRSGYLEFRHKADVDVARSVRGGESNPTGVAAHKSDESDSVLGGVRFDPIYESVKLKRLAMLKI